jgi:Terminase large subunit, T4likevirus-type, N-terminal
MIATDIARALNPEIFAWDCGVNLDPWQKALMIERPRRSLQLCCRQAGKSTVSALSALWTAIYEPPALILLVSPSQRQSAELFRTTMLYHNALKGAPELSMESVLRAEFQNGSRILALPGTERTVRGYSGADLIVVDEACRVEDALISAVRPMMATSEGGGRLWCLSTPNGKRGFMHEAWTSGDDTWHRTEVAAKDCPRISKAFLDDELRQLGPLQFSQEYSLAWLEPDEAVFPVEIIDAAFSHDVRPLWS